MFASHSEDTIFALSSGRLPAGIAVLRISGPDALRAAMAMAGDLAPARQLAVRSIRKRSGEIIDHGMVVSFPGPDSFTGEDCVELHVHGGSAVVAAVIAELGSTDGLRHAEPGEFSQRAFRNGKFDLTAAEALADLIEAETEAQRRFAVQNAAGRNAALYGQWRQALLEARALIEAELDFSDEQDVPDAVSSQVWAKVSDLAFQVRSHLDQYRRSEIIRDGFRVVILGPPNAGKSSLLNALANRDVAIVSEEPGTTRDLVEVMLDLRGIKTFVTDTAGIRDGAGPVEREGIARTRSAAGRADLVILLFDVYDPAIDAESGSWTAEVIRVQSKLDLIPTVDSRETWADLALSVRTGDGLETLIAMIADRAEKAVGVATEPAPFRQRHVVELQETVAVLDLFLAMRDQPLEISAEYLRLAGHHLGRIVGQIDIEDMLGFVFSRFCIGK
jgi:tRNA modification GTPase